MITRNFNLYLNAGHSVPLVINVNQYDQGEQWIFTLYNSNGTQYTPSTGAIVGIKSDGLGIINSGSVVDGKVVINETQQMTAAVGKAVFELTIDSGTHGTANFIVLVEEKPGNNADLSDSDLSLIQEALDAVNPLPTGGSVGQVLTKTANGSTWSDAGTPTQAQVAEAVSDWADENITVTTGVVIDTSLAVAGAAADSKKVGDEITDLKNAIAQGGSFTAEVKAALLAMFRKCLLLDGGDNAYDALESALYPPANLVSISAVYTQSGIVYDTDSLDTLKSDLVVTAHYSDSTTSTVTNYILSGTLTAGTSTITVSYGGKTTTFNVTVTHQTIPSGYTEYSYVRYNGSDISDNSSAVPIIITTNEFSDMNSLIVDFDFSPAVAQSAASGILGGHGTSTGNNYTIAFYGRTDTKRVSAFSHGTALGIDNISEVAVGNVVHVNLNPGTASSSTLTVEDSTTDGAWTTSYTYSAKFGYCGQFSNSKATLKNFAKIGTLKIYRATDNELLGEYKPCVRNADNVIGVYDTVTETFYSTSTSSYATIGNANCVWEVGNW